nr:SDR family NAD(P)-dependent oxidoreductase [Aureimonas sp. AU20]
MERPVLARASRVHSCGLALTSWRRGLARPRATTQRSPARVLDVRDVSAVTRLIAEFKRLDILVNCAGMIRPGEEFDPAIFDAVVDVKLGGTMRLCAATPACRSGDGARQRTLRARSFSFAHPRRPSSRVRRGPWTGGTPSPDQTLNR